MKHYLAIVAMGLLAGPMAAQATTVNFEYLGSGVSLAQGSFSYADGATGTLGFDDLSAFSVSIGASSYTLADIAGFNDYRWFAYDTGANVFLTGTNLCGFALCGFNASLAAVNHSETAGFFFTPAPGHLASYPRITEFAFDTIVLTPIVTPTAVPEPETLPLFGLALLGLGLTRRRRSA